MSTYRYVYEDGSSGVCKYSDLTTGRMLWDRIVFITRVSEPEVKIPTIPNIPLTPILFASAQWAEEMDARVSALEARKGL
jgi:hypothetical protein